MIIEYVRYETSAGQTEALLDAYRLAAKHLDAAPECLGYEIAQGVEEPGRVVVRIEWASIEAHERGFRGGPHFPPFLALVRPFLPCIQEMKHYHRHANGKSAAT
jgi:quinol monooxygenase YgiN